MELTTEQIQTISTWLNEGMSLSDLQKRLDADWGMRMTYMEVRFLVDDLNLELAKPKVEEKPEEEVSDVVEPEVASAVSVTVDRVTRPGSIISGTVTFSDGVAADWNLDQMGRLGFGCKVEGYNPNEEDMMEFQQKLQQELATKGYGGM
jgi:hypothetical protein